MIDQSTTLSSRSRFTRSINVEQDTFDSDALDGYVLTAGGQQILQRILAARAGTSTERAWRLTGLFGTGKSAFAVFAAQALGRLGGKCGQRVNQVVCQADTQLGLDIRSVAKLGTLWPVPVTGSREPLAAAVLRGLRASVTRCEGQYSRSMKAVLRHIKSLETCKAPRTSQIVNLFGQVLNSMPRRGGTKTGLFLIVDELGKLLEYAAENPSGTDVYLLQALAEYAVRSKQPFYILAILHQDFSAYAKQLSAEERNEWDKVSGRFEPATFAEPEVEMLRLIARAMGEVSTTKDNCSEVKPTGTGLHKQFSLLCRQVHDLDLGPAGVSKRDCIHLLEQCYPLHPLVTLLLAHVCRRFAQNERSIFSFLASYEPYGLRDFLGRDGVGLYTADRFYDYLVTTFGHSLYAHATGRRWGEVDSALSRCADASPQAICLLKTIGLLAALGLPGRILPTKDLLLWASAGGANEGGVDLALRNLRQASVIIFRKYNHSYAIWEGSDIDIEERLKVARGRLSPTDSIAVLASKCLSPRPLIARRHSFETGTLRYFTVEFAAGPEAFQLLNGPLENTDGRIVIMLPETREQEAKAEVAAKDPQVAAHDEALLVLPGNVRCFAETVRQAASLEWVQQNTPELEGDVTARKELRIRSAEVQKQLAGLLSEVLMPQKSTTGKTRWYHKGKPQLQIKSYRDLNEYLSRVCDNLFHAAPKIRNELLNRRQLSSSAAAARRDLVELMITKANVPVLGIDQNPPTKSMYLSLLERSGIHRKRCDVYGFGAPGRKADPGMRSVWAAIQFYFRSSIQGLRPVVDLFNMLQGRPYGLRAGPLPVIFCAALLANDADVALYEEGTFVPSISVAMCERLMKAPERFSVQRWQVTGVRSEVFRKLNSMLSPSAGLSGAKPDVLGIVRPLCKFAGQLNPFARQTQIMEVDDTAQRVRSVLLAAKQPDTLIFSSLPQACGITPFGKGTSSRASDVQQFADRLGQGLAALQQCYSRLLSAARTTLANAFGITSKTHLRRDLSRRCARVQPWALDQSLKMFVNRAVDTTLKDDAWLESVMTAISSKAPSYWRDPDVAAFDVSVAQIARRFAHLEALLFQSTDQDAPDEGCDAYRIGVTTRERGDIEHVVRVTRQDRTRVEAIQEAMQNALSGAEVNGDKHLVLAALARLAKEILDSTRNQ